MRNRGNFWDGATEEFFKGFISKPKWFIMRKIGRFGFIRNAATSIIKSQHRAEPYDLYSEDSSVFENINIDNVVHQLHMNGLFLPLKLPSNLLNRILEFAYSTNCYGHKNPLNGFLYQEKTKADFKHGQPFLSASYFNISELCPTIRKLESDPLLLEIAAQYLNAKPVHIRSRLWWNFASTLTQNERNQSALYFHYDLDDYKFIKFFFYLTEVDDTAGPHVCVVGSHNKKRKIHLFPRRLLTDREIIYHYGLENIITIYGQPGLGFAEDTFCFHKATAPINKDRLVLKIQFGIFNYNLEQDKINPIKLKSIFEK